MVSGAGSCRVVSVVGQQQLPFSPQHRAILTVVVVALRIRSHNQANMVSTLIPPKVRPMKT